MDDALPPLPAFLIIGAQKGATRWLRFNLGRHPDIYTPDEELAFFNERDEYERGLDYYRGRYSGWSGERVVGEATPGYMMWRHQPAVVAERIDHSLPGVQLFAILRDPVDRLYSAFVHHVWRGRLDANDDLIELVRRTAREDGWQLVAGGWYGRSLEPYLDRFGDRLHVFLNEDARADPPAVYRTALRAIGVDDAFVPDELAEVVFRRVPPKGTRYFLKGVGRRPLTGEEKATLYEYFADDVERLEQLLGRDLSAWKHTG